MRVVLLALSGEATGDCERFGTHGFGDHSEDGGVAEPRDVIRFIVLSSVCCSLLRLPVLFCLLFISINSFFQHKLLIIGPYHRAY